MASQREKCDNPRCPVCYPNWKEEEEAARRKVEEDTFVTLMRGNQFAWALNIPTGSAREIQLTLANKCTVTGANAEILHFSQEPLANLADPGQRMAFVMRAAARFDELLHNPLQKYDVENSLYVLAHPR